MAVTLNGRSFNIIPTDVMNFRDPDGDGDFDPNDPGVISVVVTSKSVDDDAGTIELSATRSGGTGAASVQWETADGTATAGASYTADSGTFSWNDGQTGSRTATLSITDRSGETQGDLNFEWRLSAASGASLGDDTTVVTITDTSGGVGTANLLADGSLPDGSFDYPVWWMNVSEYPRTNAIIEEFRPPTAQVGPNAPSTFSGDGSNCSIATPGGGGSYVDGPARSGNYSIRFALRNGSQGGNNDADPLGGSTSRRRAEMYQFRTANTIGNSIEYLKDRWCSVSYYIPSDWTDDGSDWGVIVLQMKGEGAARAPTNMLILTGGKWEYRHQWSEIVNPRTSEIPWQMQQNYKVGMSGTSTDDMTNDFPNLSTSENALASVNKGGWTDWVFHIRPDWRSVDGNHDGPSGPVFGRDSGGTGYIEVYKREDSNPFVHVISIHPRLVTVADMTWSRGINYEPDGTNWALMGGLYASWDQINVTPSRKLFVDNMNVYPSGETLDRIANRLTHG